MKIVLSGTELQDGEPIAPLCAAARRNGVGHLELWYPKNTAPAGLEATLEILEADHLHLAAIATGTELGRENDISPDRQCLHEALELAARVGCGLVNTYFGYRARQDDAAAIDAYARALEPTLERAEALGVTLTLENEFDFFGHDPAGSDPTRRADATARLFERVGSSRFRLAFDPANAFCADATVFPDYYETVRPHIGYVHVKDARRLGGESHGGSQDEPHGDPQPGWKEVTDHGRRYATCPLGEGALDWPALLSALKRDGYDGYLTLEPHSETVHRDPAWDQAAAALAGWLRDLDEK